jgi:NADH-quinone oxidoreductase subunit J
MNLLAAETALVNWHTFTFFLFALLACGFGAAVLATSNIVRMAFYLTLSLGATAGLFFLAGAEFVGAMQLMIYVGGTLVLLIFGVMLTAQERFINMKTGAGDWVVGLFVGGTLLVLLVRTAFMVPSWSHTPNVTVDEHGHVAVAERVVPLEASRTSTPIGLSLSGIRPDKLDEASSLRRSGMSGYLLPFVIISMHLLTVLIGAGYMARTKRVRTGLALEAAPRTVPANRKFPLSIRGGIVSGMVTNVLLIALSVAHWQQAFKVPQPAEGGELPVAASGWAQWLTTAYALPNWFWVALILTLLANLLFLFVVHNWQKWGLIGLVATPLLQFLLMVNAGIGGGVAGILALAMFVPAVMLVVLCVTRPRPTVWSQME